MLSDDCPHGARIMRQRVRLRRLQGARSGDYPCTVLVFRWQASQSVLSLLQRQWWGFLPKARS